MPVKPDNTFVSQAASQKFETIILVSIFTLAVIMRGLYCYELSDTPILSELIGDASLFDSWAIEIADGNWAGNHVVLQPFYPYFLGFIYKFIGHNIFVVRIIQIIIGALSCVLLAKAGKYFFSGKTGLTAGFMLAVFPSAIFFDCLIQKSVFGMFFMSFLLLITGKTIHTPKSRYFFSTGVVLGLFILVRENAIILAPFLLFWIAIYFQHHSKTSIALWITLFSLGVILVFLPVGIKNKLNTGTFSLGGSHFGSNFYWGNNPNSEGTYVELRTGRGNIVSELEDIQDLAEKDMGKKLTPAEVSNYWMNKALTYISSHPLHWINLLFKKAALIFNRVEIGDTIGIYGYAHESKILTFLNRIFHFGVLFPLAVIGLYVTFQQRKKIWLLYLVFFVYSSGLVLFFIFSRYRFPLAAVLLLFAAAGLCDLTNFLKTHSKKKRWIITALFLTAMVFSNWKLIPESISSATTYYNLARTYENNNNMKKAIQYYEAAIKTFPASAMAHNNLGKILIGSGDSKTALAHFKQAVVLNPQFADAHNNLGAALSASGKVSDAMVHLKKALQLSPDDPNIYNNLGIVFYRKGNFKKAASYFRKALILSPESKDIAHNLKNTERHLRNSLPKKELTDS